MASLLIKYCPSCGHTWSDEEIQLQQCEECGYPEHENDEYDDIFFPNENLD